MPNPQEIVAHIDGGSRGNPGPAAYGVAIKTAQGRSVAAFARFIGETTNNFAEYQGLLAALDYALSHGYSRLRVMTDSELMARQISGHYKVRSPDLKPLHEKARALIARLESFSIRHVYREQNREADRLANQALDKAERGKGFPSSSEEAVRGLSDFRLDSVHRDIGPQKSGTDGVAESAALAGRTAPVTRHAGPPQASPRVVAEPLRISATFQKGALLPHTQLPLLDGEEVDLEVHRRKSSGRHSVSQSTDSQPTPALRDDC
jgi:ribonuclease HI